jgi:CubicO group peptidase (beta-lactamase class C family)
MKATTTLATLALVVVSGAVRGRGAPDASSGLEGALDALFEPVREQGLPGAAVVVLSGSEILYAKAHGLANVEAGVPNTLDTKMRLASVTKSFTALAVLRLAERGRLSLDAPLQTYLPDFRSGERITLRQLLAHTAGVPDFVSFDEAKQGALDFEPGERLNYSNTGYIALGRVLEVVSGKSYEALLREEILDPLGMRDTGCDRRERVLKGRAAGYVFSPDLVNADYTDTAADPAAGGLYSTARDMVRFVRALRGPEIVGTDTLARAFSPTPLPGGREGAYGYGFMVTRYRGLREIGHGGDISGFNAYLALYPEVDLAVIVLSNVGMWAPGPLPTGADVAHRVVEVMARERLGPRYPPAVPVAVSTLDRYVGRYRVEAPPPVIAVMGDTLELEREGETLVAIGKQGRAEIVALSDTCFYSKAAPARIEFLPADVGGQPDAILTLMDLREIPMRRVSASGDAN